MQVQGKTLFALCSPLEVSNFPIKKKTDAEIDELKRVTLLRKIEIAEARIARELNPSSQAPDFAAMIADANASTTTAAPVVNATTTAPAENDEDDSTLVYDQIELTTNARQRHQIVLLHDAIRSAKLKFNAEFEEVFQMKRDESNKIAERRQRIFKILNELKLTEEVFEVKPHILETPEQLLVVRDDEVTVERVYTAQERAALDEAARKEADRLAAEQQDNVRERGIKEMMNNRLEAKTDEDIWIDLIKPEFIALVSPENWNDDQKRIAAEFKKQEDDLNDQRDKRRKALDAERAKLHEQIAASCDAFDSRLKALFARRIETEQQINQLELSSLQLALTLQSQEDALAREHQAYKDIEHHRILQDKAKVVVEAARQVRYCFRVCNIFDCFVLLVSIDLFDAHAFWLVT
jgi:cilia- and flagella-associated protein 43